MKKQRIRIIFSKTKAMRYTGHLDLRRAWERTMRRAALPLGYSQGFSPHPLLNLAAPLPLGFTSTHEIGDFWMSEVCDLDEVFQALEKAAPPGIKIHHIEEIPEIHGDKLPNLVQSVQYTVTFPTEATGLAAQVAALEKQEHILRKRRKKEYDLRPLIEDIEVIDPTPKGEPRLRMQLSNLSGATGRPDEVVAALGYNPLQCHICRTDIYIRREM
ncbi:MAG: hypothetical protein B6I38_02695 [Anaerolineaceae bacterium 4572_5.1]|nr:MAG: hypothetical protein B5M51_08915 [Anaerolinea sp. 4484_236]OQY34212.1 MAG: hypothetical protein B6I38_02695 [Anaerolineaceae bacterium 4572_5.1]RLD07406.1 MAG: hypothetical protein DRI56_06710 [Chloroflexota bacterium]